MAKRRIIVEVSGGVVTDVSNIPDDVEVEVRDYDVEQCEDSRLIKENDKGFEYVDSIWG